jgi:hypothetical protein
VTLWCPWIDGDYEGNGRPCNVLDLDGTIDEEWSSRECAVKPWMDDLMPDEMFADDEPEFVVSSPVLVDIEWSVIGDDSMYPIFRRRAPLTTVPQPEPEGTGSDPNAA